MPPADDLKQLRAELRRLYLAASQGRWENRHVRESRQNHLYATGGKGDLLLAMPNHRADGELMAAARNALPALFAEIDRLRGGVPVLGELDAATGRISWRGGFPPSSAA